jgi:hypothetical protein
MKNSIFILLLFLFTGCAQQLVFERKQYNSSYQPSQSANYSSAHIKIEVLEAKNDENINKIIFENIKELSNFIDNQNLTITNYNELTKGFVEVYKNTKNKKPEDKLNNWNFELESIVEYETDEFVNIGIIYTTSYGDFNKFGGKRALVFDKQTGAQLKKEAVFSHLDLVTKLVENKFKSKYAIRADKSLNQQGFSFLNDEFYLTNNIFFTIEGVKFLYNSNEISSLENRAFDVFLTYQELDNYLLIK